MWPTTSKLRAALGSLAPAPSFLLLGQGPPGVCSSRGREESLKVPSRATSHSTHSVLSTWVPGRVGITLSLLEMSNPLFRISHSLSNQWQEARIEVPPQYISSLTHSLTQVAEKMRDINVRLPTNIHPEQYKVSVPPVCLKTHPPQVHLIPFIVEDNFTIAGHVEISLNVGF